MYNLFRILGFFVVFIDRCELVERAGTKVRLGEQRYPDGNIQELPFAPSSQDFYNKYVRTSTPFIIRGAAEHWPAYSQWCNVSYLKEKHGENIFTVEKRKSFKNSHAVKNTLKFNEFLDVYENEDLYLDSLLSSKSTMLDDVILPVPLQCREHSNTISAIVLLMSSGNTSSAFHHDGYENMLTLISGRKDIILYNASYTSDLHGNEFGVVPGVSPVEPEDVDLEKFNFLKSVPYLFGTLKAGDSLYIPQYWWHQVRSYGNPNIAIGIWSSVPHIENLMEHVDAEDVVQEQQMFTKNLNKIPETITCSNHVRSLDQFLFIDTSASSSLRFRIPKRNERPQDVILASGFTMPVLGFGTSNLNESCKQAVAYALQTGYRMFDTAEIYHGAEEAIADALKESGISRNDVFIATKVGGHNLGYNNTLKAIDESLKRLKTDYIDLYYIHSKECVECEEAPGTWQESWKAMEEAHRVGKLRSLGLSNVKLVDVLELSEFSTVPLSAVQNWFDPFHQDRKLRSHCRKNNIRFVGYSVLGHQWVSLGLSENPILSLDLITEIAGHYDYVPSHVLLRWAVHENVTIIPRSSNENHIAQNYRSMDIKLQRSEIRSIHKLEDLMREVFAEEVEPYSENSTEESDDVTENSIDVTDVQNGNVNEESMPDDVNEQINYSNAEKQTGTKDKNHEEL